MKPTHHQQRIYIPYTAIWHTVVSNDYHLSPMLCNAHSMVLHARTSTDVPEHKDLDPHPMPTCSLVLGREKQEEQRNGRGYVECETDDGLYHGSVYTLSAYQQLSKEKAADAGQAVAFLIGNSRNGCHVPRASCTLSISDSLHKVFQGFFRPPFHDFFFFFFALGDSCLDLAFFTAMLQEDRCIVPFSLELALSCVSLCFSHCIEPGFCYPPPRTIEWRAPCRQWIFLLLRMAVMVAETPVRRDGCTLLSLPPSNPSQCRRM